MARLPDLKTMRARKKLRDVLKVLKEKQPSNPPRVLCSQEPSLKTRQNKGVSGSCRAEPHHTCPQSSAGRGDCPRPEQTETARVGSGGREDKSQGCMRGRPHRPGGLGEGRGWVARQASGV